MKKSILALAFLFVGSVCFSQIEVKKEEFPEYQGIVTVEGKSNDEIFNKTKEWIALNFKSANDVLQLDDKENGKLIVKGNQIISFTAMKKQWPARVHFTLAIDIKDGRFRYTYNVTDLLDESGKYPMSIMKSIQKKGDKANAIELKDNIKKAFNTNIEEIQKFITDSSKEDW